MPRFDSNICCFMSKKENVLVLGGTQFIGRNLVERLLENKHYEVTLFNRQQTGTELFPGVQKIKGDRETAAIEQLSGKTWDYVIDCSCFYPEALQAAIDALPREHLKKYIFISSCSTYDNEQHLTLKKNEDTPTLSCTAEEAIDRTDSTYGKRKAACERVLKNSGLPYTILRPALVYGPYDAKDRMYYWLYQAKMNDTLLLPDNGVRRFSITYVHDLVSSIVNALHRDDLEGVYNVVSQEATNIITLVAETCKQLSREVELVEASRSFLYREKVSQWVDMPLWIDGDHFTYSNQKMRQDLVEQPVSLSQSLETTLAYYTQLQWPVPRYGIPEKTRHSLLQKVLSAELGV